jgi:hypothetical protein
MSGEESFRRFVAERLAALLSTALLLTGDRGSAEDLVLLCWPGPAAGGGGSGAPTRPPPACGSCWSAPR